MVVLKEFQIDKTSDDNEITQLIKYIGKFREEVGYYLNSISDSNVFPELSDYLNQTVIEVSSTSNIKTTDEGIISEIKDIEQGLATRIVQTAELIDLEVTRATEAEGTLQANITVTAEAISNEVTRASNAEGNLSTRITQTAEAITSEATRASNSEEALSSRITQTAEDITSEVTRASNAEGNLSSRITQTAEDITSEVTRASNAEDSLSSRITQTANDITSEVKRASDAETDLSSKITQTASDITTEVSRAKGEESKIKQEADKISWVVKSGDSASNMTLTDKVYLLVADNVTLKGNHIQLDGNTTIGQGFVLTADHMDVDSIFTNEISFSKGFVGGWKVNDTMLLTTTDNPALGSGLLSSGHNDIAFYAGANINNIANAKTRIYRDGRVYTDDLTVYDDLVALKANVAENVAINASGVLVKGHGTVSAPAWAVNSGGETIQYDSEGNQLFYSDGLKLWGLLGGQTYGVESTWYKVCASTCNYSDRRIKENIEDISEDEKLTAMFDNLKPVTFNFRDGSGFMPTQKHIGFIAQDVEQAIEDSNITDDLALFDHTDPNRYGVDKSELIALCVNEIQKLKKEIKELKEGR